MDYQKIITNLRSPLFLVSITAILILALAQTINQQQNQKLLDLRTAHYGTSLAKLTAGQAANATLNSDLVSLQVGLENLIKNPHVLSATIHDVENQLLVQAGDSPTLGQYSSANSRSFTAPITLHDSVAGYVAVTLDTQAIYATQDNAWLIGLVAICLMLMIFSLMTSPKLTNSRTPEPNPEQEHELPTHHNASADDVQVVLLLHVLNIDTLRKQINGSLRGKLFAELGKKIDGINMLYNGKIESASENWLSIRYGGDDIADASFRAACAAILLFRLIDESDDTLQLQLSGAIYLPGQQRQLTGLLEESKFTQQCHSELQDSRPQQLLLHQQAINDNLTQRLITEGDSQWAQVQDLHSGYTDLLNKQCQQLRTMLQHL